jgi:hypothetical protein
MISASSVVWRDSPDYEEARVGRVFNRRRPDRYPRGVIQPVTVEEVANAVKLAKEMGLRVSVRSGKSVSRRIFSYFGCLRINLLSKCLTTHETLSTPKLYQSRQY